MILALEWSRESTRSLASKEMRMKKNLALKVKPQEKSKCTRVCSEMIFVGKKSKSKRRV